MLQVQSAVSVWCTGVVADSTCVSLGSRKTDNMAGLSSNVMNMKFMQRAQTKKNEKKNEDAIRKVKDSSEWVLPNKTSLQAKTKPAVQVQTVGYGSIATLMTKKEEIKEDDKSNNEASNELIKVCMSIPDQ